MQNQASTKWGAALRFAEFLLLFVLLPAAVAALNRRGPVLIFLWILTAICLLLLLTDRTFDRRQLWNAAGIGRNLGRAALRFLGFGLVLAAVAWHCDQEFWRASLLLRHPHFWAIMMVAYPLLSVYPQGIVYRNFILHRYRNIFPGEWPLALASALAFGFTHIVFHNWQAPVLTFLGGLMFVRTYQRTRSQLAASLEHAFYGCLIFTIGLGHYFFAGTQRLVQSLPH